MKINFITFSSKLTGGTRVVMEMINALAKRGHKVNLVSLGSPDDLQWIKLSARTYFVRRSLLEKICGFLYRKVFGFQPFPEEETRKILKILPNADVNIATISYSAFAAVRAPYGVPFHYFMHYEPLVREEGYKKKIIEESYYLPTKKIANSTWLARQIEEKTGGVVTGVVFPAIDHRIFYPRRKKDPLNKNRRIKIVSLAKYKWWKGTPDALRVVQMVRDAGYNVEFSMFGNFDPKTLPDDLKDVPFNFVGFKKDNELADFYSNADILISTSYFESFPLPQLEAMACGTPVITTRYGTEDYAFSEENSLVVEPRKPEEMAKAIIRLINDPELYLKISLEGIKTAKNFTWENSAERMETILLQNA